MKPLSKREAARLAIDDRTLEALAAKALAEATRLGIRRVDRGARDEDLDLIVDQLLGRFVAALNRMHEESRPAR